MANKNIKEVWAGPGTLSMGRRKITVGDPIPKELADEARKSLRAKGKIVDEVVADVVDLSALAKDAVIAADMAQAESEEAMNRLGDLSAKANADKAKASDKEAFKVAEKEASALAETAARLRMEADQAIEAAK